MTLAEYFREQYIFLFSSLDAKSVPVVRPRLLAPVSDARSVVFAAIPYFVKEEASNLAMFARARDYHAYSAALGAGAASVLHERHPGCAVSGFADHSPYSEVQGAAMAGIGVMGENGLLITKPYSSFVFLFDLVTSLTQEELESEGIPRGSGEIHTCRRCGRCRSACPGGCIGEDSDERALCASAVSQKKGELSPQEIDILLASEYAWGCDTCQNVCPYTAEALRAGTIESRIPFFREGRIGILTEQQIRAMTEEEYRAYAFGWRKKDVMLRNLRLREGKHD